MWPTSISATWRKPSGETVLGVAGWERTPDSRLQGSPLYLKDYPPPPGLKSTYSTFLTGFEVQAPRVKNTLHDSWAGGRSFALPSLPVL